MPIAVPVRPGHVTLKAGVQATVLGFGGNSGSNIFTPTDERFTVSVGAMEAAGFEAGIAIANTVTDPGSEPRPEAIQFYGRRSRPSRYIDPPSVYLYGQAGGALGQTTVASPVASTDKTLSGPYYGLGVKVPLRIFVPGPPNNILIGFQWRHADLSGNVPLFGPGTNVHISQVTNTFTGTISVPLDALLVIDQPAARR